jgi:lipid-A-disaccharide synthase
MKYYIIAGEASGDLHAGNLISQLKNTDNNTEFRGFGGDKMAEAGAHITVHYRQMAFMGAFEVLVNYRKIKKNFKICRKDILEFNPDTVILVDYAGFNLRMAKFTKEHKFTNLFYISPKVWAWNKSRIKKIKKYIDQLYLILPFEKEFFRKYNYTDTEYIGNPITDAISSFRSEKLIPEQEFRLQAGLDKRPIIALLAGSRKQEIIRLLPEIINVVDAFPNYQFVIAGAPSISKDLYASLIKNKQVPVLYDQTYQILSHSYAAVVASGTATLETALFRVPQVVVYKFNTLSFVIFKPFIHIKFFSLVNIILDKTAVKEYLQFGLARKIKAELERILTTDNHYKQILADYDNLISMVGGPGSSKRAAEHIIKFLKSSRS